MQDGLGFTPRRRTDPRRSSDYRQTLRGLFLIDREGIVGHALASDLPLGRNVDEALRMLDARRFHEEQGDFCPANWKRSEEGIKPTSQGVVDYLSWYATQRPGQIYGTQGALPPGSAPMSVVA